MPRIYKQTIRRCRDCPNCRPADGNKDFGGAFDWPWCIAAPGGHSKILTNKIPVWCPLPKVKKTK